MRKWYVLITIVTLGLAVAFIMLFLAAKAPAPSNTTSTAPKGFVSFFGRRFGLGGSDQATTTLPIGTTTEATRPDFRARLAAEKMISISPQMISGITFTASTTATTTLESARYVLRETGRIEDMSLVTGETKRVTNTTVPRIQEALFGVNGSVVALRYLGDDNETVETYVAPLPTDPFASSTELIGTFFAENIPSLAWSPTTTQLFYLLPNDTGVTGRIASYTNTTNRTVFSSPLKEWNVAWSSPSAALVTTKPSYLALGAAARVITNVGQQNTLLSGVFGLTTLPSPSMTRILYSQSNGNRTQLFVYDTTTRTSTQILLPTLPEKCVWADDIRVICAVPTNAPGTLPDAWYQGSISFADTFWMADTQSNQVAFLFDPSETPARENVDAIDLALSHDNTVLGFINKKDLRGWVADLSEWF